MNWLHEVIAEPPVPSFSRELAKIFDSDDNNDWHTIFVVEGILMYLDQGKCAAVLEACMCRGGAGKCSLVLC